jgi:hypothetical protein
VYEAFVKAYISPFDNVNYEGDFGIDLILTVPNTVKNFPLNSIQKPLLDGLICSFQSFVPLKDTSKLNAEARQKYEMLESIYWQYRLLHVGQRGGLHFDPADNKLVCCNIRVIGTNASVKEIAVSGDVYTVKASE